MSKTIIIIDILNLIANEEWDKLPRKIKIYNEEYILRIDEDFTNKYNYFSVIDQDAFGANYSLEYCLNDEVEIIEEQPKTIEKFEIVDNDLETKHIVLPGGRKDYSECDILFAEKINWLIDKVSEK